MATAPYGVRLLVGAAATAVEETLKLPQTILTYPMTVVSQVAHLVMKMQQDVADLVNKGDEHPGGVCSRRRMSSPNGRRSTRTSETTRRLPRRSDDGERAAPRAGSRCTPMPATPGQPRARRRASAERRRGKRPSPRSSASSTTRRSRWRSCGPGCIAAGRRTGSTAGLRGGHQGPGPVPDAAGQQDHPRDRQVSADGSRANPRSNPFPVRASRSGGQGLDRQARHRLGRGSDRPAQRCGRTRARRSWCCATRQPTCRCR